MKLSLHGTVESALENILGGSGLPHVAGLLTQLGSVIDALDRYTEEGRRLYPELILSTDIEALLKEIPYRKRIVVGTADLADGLTRALKRCATAAVGGWVVYAEVQEKRIEYGLVCAEGTDMSPNLYDQLLGEFAVGRPTDVPLVYLRQSDAREVEVRTSHSMVRIGLGLGPLPVPDSGLRQVAKQTTASVPADRRVVAEGFMGRLLDDAVRDAHGCLIGVVGATKEEITELQAALQDGAYLNPPIDFMELLRQLDEERTREASAALRQCVVAAKGMIGMDGIAIITSDARLVAYNVFIPQPATAVSHGGARRRAFKSLTESGLVKCAVAVSHDGAVTLWKQEGETKESK